MNESTLHPNVQRVQTALDASGVETLVRVLPDSTRSAQEAADALGVTVGQIGKSIVFGIPGKTVVAVLPGDRKVSLDRLNACFNATFGKLSGIEVKERTGYPIGGVSPLGLPDTVELVIDDSLNDYDDVWVAAGTPNAVVQITPVALQGITKALVAEISVPS